MLTRHHESRDVVSAPVADVFAHLDDHSRLSSHMSKSSWMMGGGRMETILDAQRGQAIGSTIRIEGVLFGVRLFVEEVVIDRQPLRRKVWETVGTPRLLVIGSYRMGFDLTPRPGGSELRVFIDYALPERGVARWLGRLVAGYYAKWCTRRMVTDAVKVFATAGEASVMTQPVRAEGATRRSSTTLSLFPGAIMRLDSRAFGLAAGSVTAALFVLCALAVALAPAWTTSVASSLIHLDLTGIARTITWGGFFGGLLFWSIGVGLVFAAVGRLYNRFAGPVAAAAPSGVAAQRLA